jgi:hypothetical protein
MSRFLIGLTLVLGLVLSGSMVGTQAKTDSSSPNGPASKKLPDRTSVPTQNEISDHAQDISNAQELTRLQDRLDAVNDKLGDIKDNTKKLLESNNRSVDLVKDLCIGIIAILLAMSCAIAALFTKFENAFKVVPYAAGKPIESMGSRWVLVREEKPHPATVVLNPQAEEGTKK